MAKEVETVSMSFLDVLCSALGGVVFLMLIMSLTIKPGETPPSAGYFLVDISSSGELDWQEEVTITLFPSRENRDFLPVRLTGDRTTSLHPTVGGTLMWSAGKDGSGCRILWSDYHGAFQLHVGIELKGEDESAPPDILLEVSNTRGKVATQRATFQNGQWISPPMTIPL